jgi:hypothetical protein
MSWPFPARRGLNPVLPFDADDIRRIEFRRGIIGASDPFGGASHRAEAVRLTAVADPLDREVLEVQRASGPWFGLDG